MKKMHPKHLLPLFCLIVVGVFTVPKAIAYYKELTGPDVCVSSETKIQTTRQQAIAIAQNSSCATNAKIITPYALSCNDFSGIWEIAIIPNQTPQGCTPTCYVDVSAGKAEINYRCTGLQVK